jgi:hypothetical protein
VEEFLLATVALMEFLKSLGRQGKLSRCLMVYDEVLVGPRRYTVDSTSLGKGPGSLL